VNIALVTISDRGDLYLPRMLASFDKWVQIPTGGWSAEIHVDDHEHALGMAGAVRDAWGRLPKDTDYVFHVEEDWLFLRNVPVEAMCRTLEQNAHLAQLVLKRGPWSPEEHAAGGIIEQHPDEYEDTPGWVEHSRIFSLNPCVYPYWITQRRWPDTNEAGFTEKMVKEGMRFAFWGSRCEDPYIEHIGVVRGSGWHL